MEDTMSFCHPGRIWGGIFGHGTDSSSQAHLEPLPFIPNRESPLGWFPESPESDPTNIGFLPFLPETSGYVDENSMLPTTGFEYNPNIAAQATFSDGHEVQAVHTQFPGLMSGEFAPAGTLLDQIPLDQAASTSTRVTSHDSSLRCYECGYVGQTYFDLDGHGNAAEHAPYRCRFPECESTFSRHDVMIRHLKQHDDLAARHPCPHCRKYRGPNGFKRMDHLQQHIMNYHHIDISPSPNSEWKSYHYACPKAGCPEYRENSFYLSRRERPFSKKSEYTEHMKKAHNESPFPCDAPGCDRVDGKGFFRKSDLRKHKAKKHAVNAE